MKRCPKCSANYSDDTLRFCLQDGTPLLDAGIAGPTSVFGEEETVIARKGGDIHASSGGAPDTAWGRPESQYGQSQVTRVASGNQQHGVPVQQKSGLKTILAVLITAVVMLVLFGILGLAAYLWLRPSPTEIGKNKNPNVNISVISTPTPYPSVSPSATGSRTPTPFPTSTPFPTPTSTVPPLPTPPALKSYPSTSRLTFSRGAYSTTFTGDLNPNGSRSLVLYCRAGQSLSATISSGGGCVSVRGGGTSYRTATSSGDNYIVLNNSCSSVVRFTVNVSVF